MVLKLLGPPTWDSVVAIGLFLIAALPTAYIWGRRKWGRFEIRFLDPDILPTAEKEQRTIALRLLPGESVVRVSIRPRVPISYVTRFVFSAFDNRWYPLRLWPGKTGKRVSTSLIAVKRIRYQKQDRSWSDWHILSKPAADTSWWDTSEPFFSGSRRVFDIIYCVDTSKAGWDGILGMELQYESPGHHEHAYVNSKAFVANNGGTPLTFKFRKKHSSRAISPSDSDKADSE